MRAILEEKEEETVEEETAAAEGKPLPTDDAVTEAFGTLAENYVAKPRVYSMFKRPTLRFAEEEGVKAVTLVVINEAQKKYVEEQLLRPVENELRRILATPQVRLLVDVTPDDKVEKKPYFPGEQAMDLMSKNAEVRELVSQMSLETK